MSVHPAIAGYGFVLPAMAGLFMFGIAPLVYALVVNLNTYDLVNPHPPFVGLANYGSLVNNQVF
jgi:multiple sugar transport system permease protein